MTLRLFPTTLRSQLALAFSTLLVCALGLTITQVIKHSAQTQFETQRALGRNLVSLLEPLVNQWAMQPGKALEQINPALAKSLRDITRNPVVGSLHIADPTGRTLYSQESNLEPASTLTRWLVGDNGQAQQVAAEFGLPGGRASHVELVLSYGLLNASLPSLVWQSAFILILVVILTSTLACLLLKHFTAPLQSFTEVARRAAHGAWSVPVQHSSYPELEALNQAFTASSAQMQHSLRDLAETRELLIHSENRLRRITQGVHEILFELDQDGDISFLNPAWQRLTGLDVELSLGQRFSKFLTDPEVQKIFSVNQLSELRIQQHEMILHTIHDRPLWVSMDAEAQHDADGRFTGVVGSLTDITQRVELNRQLSRYQDDLYELTVTDPLTGLYNRRHFDAQLEVILAEHLPHGQPVCLLIIDVDGFKFINDTYGHPAGDQALRTIASLLRGRARRQDYIARVAGDEFAMVLKHAGLHTATEIANSLHDAINDASIDLPIGNVQLRCSIGVAAAPVHGNSAQELVSAADVAVYHAKRRGRNRIEVLSPDISKALMSVFSQGFQLRNALENGNVLPAFQPICDIASGQPVAYEALARMQHNGALIQAADFIGVAGELGLTREIDLHIIEQSLRLAPLGYGLFLNLDPSSFNDRDFALALAAQVGPACRAGRSITIEITERENVVLGDALFDDIQSLRNLGCKLALDDFGSGYSTYHFLNLFRPEYIKIEGAFVRRMLEHPSDRKIVQHIHDLAQSFGAQTIAESVEDEATRNALLELGIRNAQGMHLGSPRLSGEHFA